MFSPNAPILQDLHRPNLFSSDLRDKFSRTVWLSRYKRCMSNLQRDDLAWLVDYLDKLCHRAALPHSPLSWCRLPAVLQSRFLNVACELRNLCGTGAALQISRTFLPSLLSIGPDPATPEGYGYVHEGTLNGSRVCIKHVRVYSTDAPQRVVQVRC